MKRSVAVFSIAFCAFFVLIALSLFLGYLAASFARLSWAPFDLPQLMYFLRGNALIAALAALAAVGVERNLQ